MSPRPNVSAERKPQILNAALRVFLKKGFSSARMEDIAAACALSVGNLYRYFSGKLKITLALMDLLLAPSLEILEGLLSAPGTVRQRLEQAFIAEMEEQDLQALALYNELYHLARYEPRVRARLAKYNAQYQQKIQTLIEQGVARKELRPVNAAALAFTFQIIFDGLMQNAALTPKALDLPAAIHQAFDLIFDDLEI